MAHSSTNNLQREAAWNNSQKLENARIAASEPQTYYRFSYLTIADIRSRAQFIPLEPLIQDGKVVQYSMKIFIKEWDNDRSTLINSQYTIYAFVNDGTITDMQCMAPDHRKHNATPIMEALKERMAENAQVRGLVN